MKKILFINIFILFSLTFIFSQKTDVLGYLPTYSFDEINEIDFSLVSHVNISFANPDVNGELQIESENLVSVINYLNDKGVIVYISLGGADVYEQLADNWKKYMSQSYRSDFIYRIKEYCLQNKFQGVDMDLEWDNVTSLYSPFVIELSDTLHKYNLGFSAALPGTTRYKDISDKALKVFDVVNLMVYDFTGPWTPNNPGQHSSYNHAVQSINYWKENGLMQENMRLGVPFYGYDFSDINNIGSFNYSEMVAEDSDYAYLDKVGMKYYNGINTIKKKTKLAKTEKLKGIMIWELGQDAFSPNEEFSLLKAINDASTGLEQITEKKQKQIFHPNPFKDKLTISLPVELFNKKLYFKIVDVNNIEVYKNLIDSQDIFIGDLKKGVYFYTLKTDKLVYKGRLIKI